MFYEEEELINVCLYKWGLEYCESRTKMRRSGGLKLTVIFVVLVVIVLIPVNEAMKWTNSNQKQYKKNIVDEYLDLEMDYNSSTARISRSRSRDIASQSRRLLRRMERQNQLNSEHLDECYEQLGKYTRLLLVQHANAELGNSSNRYLNLEEQRLNGFKGYAMFIMQTELEYYLLELIMSCQKN